MNLDKAGIREADLHGKLELPIETEPQFVSGAVERAQTLVEAGSYQLAADIIEASALDFDDDEQY